MWVKLQPGQHVVSRTFIRGKHFRGALPTLRKGSLGTVKMYTEVDHGYPGYEVVFDSDSGVTTLARATQVDPVGKDYGKL